MTYLYILGLIITTSAWGYGIFAIITRRKPFQIDYWIVSCLMVLGIMLLTK